MSELGMNGEVIGARDRWFFYNPILKKKVGPFTSKTRAYEHVILTCNQLVAENLELTARLEETRRAKSILEKALKKKEPFNDDI